MHSNNKPNDIPLLLPMSCCALCIGIWLELDAFEMSNGCFVFRPFSVRSSYCKVVSTFCLSPNENAATQPVPFSFFAAAAASDSDALHTLTPFRPWIMCCCCWILHLRVPSFHPSFHFTFSPGWCALPAHQSTHQFRPFGFSPYVCYRMIFTEWLAGWAVRSIRKSTRLDIHNVWIGACEPWCEMWISSSLTFSLGPYLAHWVIHSEEDNGMFWYV